MHPPILQACLNGLRSSTDHPAIPRSPDELAADAVQAVEAGADALHIHIFDEQGRETLAPDDLATSLTAVRENLPDIPVGISTHQGIAASHQQRLEAIRGWTALPDYASVNVNEPGAGEVIKLLTERGVGIEAGIWFAHETEDFLAISETRACLRILIEIIITDHDDARCEAMAIIKALQNAGIDRPLLLHGLDDCAWPMIELAQERGLSTRVGFEDMLQMPDGRTASSNAALIKAAAALVPKT